jgi:hypothetical protein
MLARDGHEEASNKGGIGPVVVDLGLDLDDPSLRWTWPSDDSSQVLDMAFVIVDVDRVVDPER